MALSLTQPWATLVAIGAKTFETRSWSTRYRGPLAIHATREAPRWSQDEGTRFAIDARLRRAGFETSEGLEFPAALLLPRSAVVATAVLGGILPSEDVVGRVGHAVDRHLDELLFGDFSDGRFAWALGGVRRILVPVPARGRQGIWVPDPDLLAQILSASVVLL